MKTEAGPVTRRKSEAGSALKREGTSSPATDHSTVHRLHRNLGNHAIAGTSWPIPVQAKLKVGATDDRFEREANRMADHVMRMPEPSAPGPTLPEMPRGPAAVTRDAELRSVPEATVRRKDGPVAGAPSSARSMSPLGGAGQPMPGALRAYFEPRFGRDFAQVRLHTGTEAGTAARGIGARAFTYGANVAIGSGADGPDSAAGRWLLAHELTHVAQQGHAPAMQGPPQPVGHVAARSAEARRPLVTPVRPAARARIQRQAEVEDLPAAAESGLLHPTAPTNGVRVDVLAHLQGGMMHDTSLRPRISAIIGPGATVRGIARTIRPHFVAATPSPSATVDSSAPSVEELAKAILVYSRFYLPVPSGARGSAAVALANFRVGQRLTLPIEIDVQTAQWIVSPPLVRLWAGSFETAWQPFLDQPAAGFTPRATADLNAEVDLFLRQNTTAFAQGSALSGRALTSPLQAAQFALRVFDRLEASSAGSAFNAALDMMNWSVNHQIGLLARLGSGAAIIWRLRTLLNLPPTRLSAAREAERARALRMLPGEFTLGETAGGRPLKVYHFPGRTTRRALVIGGVHGSEASGVQVVELLKQSLESAGQRPFFTVILVPVMFPDNLARRAREGATPTNRNFPAPGDSLASARERGQARRRPRGPIGQRGRAILPENIMLMNLIERYRPERIASVHSTVDSGAAGVFSDPVAGPPRDLALEMADQVRATNPDWARGNADRNAVWSGGTPGGTSLGGWGPGAVAEGRETDRSGALVITVEVRRGFRSDDPGVRDPDERLREIETHRDALRDIFLGPPRAP